eukprot:6210529-Pleurochrysis_carterae.AAC.1
MCTSAWGASAKQRQRSTCTVPCQPRPPPRLLLLFALLAVEIFAKSLCAELLARALATFYTDPAQQTTHSSCLKAMIHHLCRRGQPHLLARRDRHAPGIGQSLPRAQD